MDDGDFVKLISHAGTRRVGGDARISVARGRSRSETSTFCSLRAASVASAAMTQ